MDNGTQEQDIVLDLESDDVGVSLPNAEEMKLDAVTMSKGREAKAKAFKLYGILFACVLALIIGLAVGLSDKKPDNASGVAATAPTGGDGSGSVATGDDTSPTVTVNTNGFDGAGSLERYQKTFHILKEISEETVLSKQFTPQNKAANWIANIDEKELDVPTTLAGTASYSFVQRYVLALLYYEWEGSDWTFGSKFLTNNDECDWNIGFQTDAKHSYKFGASCAGEDQRISQIFMPGNNLHGSLPMEIGHMTHLTHLSLYDNTLTGTLPQTLVYMTDLQFLGVESNKLTGFLPHYLSTKVQYLALGDNSFKGSIPSSMSTMQGLIEVSLDGNKLTGSIDSLKELPNLKRLYLGHNNLAGVIDDAFLAGSNLEELDISHNDFSGTVPVHFFNDKKLKIIDISSNNLNGGMSTEIEKNTHIKYFSAYNNQMVGEIPSTIDHLSHLTHLDLSGNKLTGTIPASFKNMTRLEYLFLANNDLTKGPIPDLSTMTSLGELSLKGTQRTGSIPTSLTSLTNMVLLDLGANELDGKMPHSLEYMTKLQYLVLNSNKLTGTITSGLKKLTDMNLLLLDDNLMTGGASHACGTSNYPSIFASDDSIMSADCTTDEFKCSCCDYCCAGMTNDECYENEDLLANLDLDWEQRFSLNTGYDRSNGFVFSENIEFRPRARDTEN